MKFMKNIRFLFILFICLQLVCFPIYGQSPINTQEIIGINVLSSDNQAIEYINQKGFVAKTPTSKQIYYPYINRVLPTYVTADSLLQTFQIIYQDAVVKLEEVNTDKILFLTKILLDKTIAGLAANPSPEIKLALEKNLQALQLLATILDDQEKSPSLSPIVNTELQLIDCADSTETSPILGTKLDYRIFQVPKEKTGKRAKLFQALTWLENWQMRLDEDLASRQTLLLALEFAIDERLLLLWKEIDQPFNYLFGETTGLLIEQITPTVKYMIGHNPLVISEIDDTHLKTFQRLISRINTSNEPFKLYGKRLSLKEKLLELPEITKENTRVTIASLFSSSIKAENAKALESILLWQEKEPNSYFSQLLDCYKALLRQNLDDRLKFVNNPAWQDRLSTAVSASWAAQYLEASTPYKSSKVRDGSRAYQESFHGYVEPNKAFFVALLRLSKNLQSVLIKNRIFISQIDEFIVTVKTLQTMVEKQSAGIDFSEKEIDLLENYGEQLARLSFIAGDYQHIDVDQSFIATITSKKSYQVLAGLTLTLYVVIPYDNKQYLCQGAISSYYELNNKDKNLENFIMPYQYSYICCPAK